MPRGFRDMKRELEQAERKNPVNMTDHELREESLNIAARNPTGIYVTEEQKNDDKRGDAIFKEQSNRVYEKVYGHRPTTTEQFPVKPLSQPPPPQPELNDTEKQATKYLKFTTLINPKKAYGVTIPRKKEEPR